MPVTKHYRVKFVTLLTVSLVIGIARPSMAVLDKTRFVAHLGVAYFCFHHWVSNPYRDGKFEAGAPHRTTTIIKAGGALLFAVHEAKVSSKIAHLSKDKMLQKVAGSLDAMTNSFSTVGERFKSGKFSKSDYDSLNGSFGAMDASARASSIQVKDVPVTIPGQ
jgi:hypothetical protein